jgi:hypothetical protein
MCKEMERVMEARSFKGSTLSIAKENDQISQVSDAEYWLPTPSFDRLSLRSRVLELTCSI